MKLKYCLTCVMPRVFVLQMEDRYDLANAFWRVQEFYESPEFKGKNFTLEEYMRWYAKEYGEGSFSYAKDWSGFNVPSKALNECYEKSTEFLAYDSFMLDVMATCQFLSGDESYYLIGVNPSAKDVIYHEIAHALFSTNHQYADEMHGALFNLDVETKNKLHDVLKEMGYATSVHMDEIQAYLSTGLYKGMHFVNPEQCTPFNEIFERFVNAVSLPYYPVSKSY